MGSLSQLQDDYDRLQADAEKALADIHGAIEILQLQAEGKSLDLNAEEMLHTASGYLQRGLGRGE